MQRETWIEGECLAALQFGKVDYAEGDMAGQGAPFVEAAR